MAFKWKRKSIELQVPVHELGVKVAGKDEDRKFVIELDYRDMDTIFLALRKYTDVNDRRKRYQHAIKLWGSIRDARLGEEELRKCDGYVPNRGWSI